MLISHTGPSADQHFDDHSKNKRSRDITFNREVVHYDFDKFLYFELNQTILDFFLY